MNFDQMPQDDIERLAFYQRERMREQREADRIREKKKRGEATTEQEDVFWASSRFGSASQCGY